MHILETFPTTSTKVKQNVLQVVRPSQTPSKMSIASMFREICLILSKPVPVISLLSSVCMLVYCVTMCWVHEGNSVRLEQGNKQRCINMEMKRGGGWCGRGERQVTRRERRGRRRRRGREGSDGRKGRGGRSRRRKGKKETITRTTMTRPSCRGLETRIQRASTSQFCSSSCFFSFFFVVVWSLPRDELQTNLWIDQCFF